MKIKIYWSWELPSKVNDIAIIIDVNAATTNIPLMLYHKVKKLIIVNEKNVLLVKKKIPKALIIGESHSLPKSIFSSSNLPSEIINLKLKDKTVLYMSNNGSRVIEKAFKLGAQTIITAAFVNFQSVIDWLSKNQDQTLTLIPAGEIVFPDRKSHEDYYCAQAIKNKLENKGNILKFIKQARKFVSQKYYPYLQDIQKNLKIEFNLDKYPVIPLCSYHNENEIIVSKV